MQTFAPRTRQNNQLGFNLIEAAIVLGIVGLVIGGVFAAWGAVTSQQRVHKASDQTTAIVSQIRSAYASRSTFDSTDQDEDKFTAALVAANLIPIEFMSGTDVKNPWNGKVTVLPDTNGMTIKYTNVNKPDCLKLASAILNNAKTQGLTKVGATAVTSTSIFTSLPTTICDASPITFYFTLKN